MGTPRPWKEGEWAVRCFTCGFIVRLNLRTVKALSRLDKKYKRTYGNTQRTYGNTLHKLDDIMDCCDKPNYFSTLDRELLPDRTVSKRELYGP